MEHRHSATESNGLRVAAGHKWRRNRGGDFAEQRNVMSNLQRRLKKLEALLTDDAGLVPHSPQWLAYWTPTGRQDLERRG